MQFKLLFKSIILIFSLTLSTIQTYFLIKRMNFYLYLGSFCLSVYNDFIETASFCPKGDCLERNNWKLAAKPSGQLEDAILKTGAQFFGEELLQWLGIRERAIGIAPTELIHLETRKMYQDFNFVMENGWWYHFEFESDRITKEDLCRFREYEAATSRTYGVQVLTIVICTARVHKVLSQITMGINTYKVKVIRLKKKDGDKRLQKIHKKKHLNREDFITVLLSPLMGGKSSVRDRILNGLQILKKEEHLLTKEEVGKMEAMLYALANKLLNLEDLDRVKEAVKMTRLGEMLRADFMEEGMKEQAERYNRLILQLDKDGKTSLIVKAAADPELLEQLFREYNI